MKIEKFLIVFAIFLAFSFGMMIVPKTPSVEQPTCDYSKYEELVKTDDELITLLSKGLVLAGEGYNQISEGNAEGLTEILEQTDAMLPDVTRLREKRIQLVNELTIDKIKTN